MHDEAIQIDESMFSFNHKKVEQICRWHSFSNSLELEHTVVADIQLAAQQAIEARGTFLIVLAGGTTPRRVYEELRHIQTDWHSWHVYFGDERCLPIDHIERNSQMAAMAWLDHVDIPSSQIHPIPAEKGVVIAAETYAQLLNTIALFDVVILGLGEDGHTASLFPDHDIGDAQDAPPTLAVLDAPKPPAHRVTLSAHRLSKARYVLFLIVGNNKANAVQDWRSAKLIPAALITPENGVDVYIEGLGAN